MVQFKVKEKIVKKDKNRASIEISHKRSIQNNLNINPKKKQIET